MRTEQTAVQRPSSGDQNSSSQSEATPTSAQANRVDAQHRYRETTARQKTGGEKTEPVTTNAAALEAQNPEEVSGTTLAAAYKTASGIPAILKSFEFGFGEMGVARTARTFLKVNQKNGYDCQSCAWASPDENRKIFEFCENGAKAIADEATRKRITPEFFKQWSVAELAGQSDYWLNQQGRLTEPMVLRKNATHYSPISWSDAFALVAENLNALVSPNEATFYTSGKTTNEAAFLFQLLARQFGTNNLPDCSNMCHEASGTAMVESLGVGKGTVKLEDFEQCDLIFVIGQNPGTNHPRMLTSLMHAKEKGAKIVAVNPLPETGLMRFKEPNPQEYGNVLKYPLAMLGKGVKLADYFLQVKINGDAAAIKGILKTMLEKEEQSPGTVFDHGFIERYTSGYEAVIADLQQTTWREITENSGVAEAEIRAVGNLAAAAKRMICCWAMGLTQHKSAVGTIQTLVNLLLIGGHIGRPGAGTCCVRGHSNVQGDRTMGIWERMPQGFLDALGREFNFTPPAAHGLDTVDGIVAMHEKRIKVFLAISGNFLTNTPDTAYTAEAMRGCALTAYVSTKLNRAHLVTGEQALILPCLGRSERDAQKSGEQFTTVEDSMGIVNPSRGSLKPASRHLLSDVAIIAGIAQATLAARGTVDWQAMTADYDRIRDAISRVVPGFENFNERIKANIFYLPNAARDRAFKTESGKAVFSVHPLPKHELAPGQLLMMTIRSHDQFNSTIYGLNDRYRGVYGGRRVIFLNEDDVQERGLRAGQLVDITSHFEGEVRFARHFIVVPYDIPRTCAATYYPETNVLVPVRSVGDGSNTPTSKSIVISIQASPDEPQKVDLQAKVPLDARLEKIMS